LQNKKENQNDFLFYSKVNCSFDKAKNTGKSFFRLTKLASLDKNYALKQLYKLEYNLDLPFYTEKKV
jgi:hypothetical protein